MLRFLNILVIIIFFANIYLKTHAQDIHFSNFQYSSITYNPANSGAFEGAIRANFLYKNQWQNVPVKYNTFLFNTDISIMQSTLKNDKLGIGLQIMSDKAGDGNLQNNMIGITSGFTKNLSKKQFLSLGFGFQYHQRRFDTHLLQFDENNTEPEQFSNAKVQYFNSSLGLAYRIKFTDNFKWSNNLGFFNILKPKTSFFDDATTRIPTRISFSSYAEMRGDGNAIFIPKILYSKQAAYSEIIGGAEIKFMAKESMSTTQGYNIGANWRYKDAISPFVGYFLNGFSAIISYDINTSAFQRASHNNGGFEISVTYIHPKEKIRKFKGKCPIF